MNEKRISCPLCNSSNLYISQGGRTRVLDAIEDTFGTNIICNGCFSYNLHESILYKDAKQLKQYDKEFVRRTNVIYEYFLKNQNKRDYSENPYVFYYPITNEERISKDGYINVESLMFNYPTTLLEKTDRILLNFSVRHKYHDDLTLNYLPNTFFFCDSWSTDELKTMFAFLEEMGYIKNNMISAKGWQRIDELRKKDTKKQAFVAMWFPNKENEKFSLMTKVRNSIKTAIEASGYIPIIIDEKEHNKLIVSEIIYEIKNSKFLVADITGHRNGVYYEAGIMEGIGREVIICCEKTDFDKRHFDIAQINTIVYENEYDLLERLKTRIRATIH